jgi:hypothetical protein
MYITLEPLYSKFKSLCYMSGIVTKPPAKFRQSTILERKDIRYFAAEFGQDLGPAQPSYQWECAALKSGVQYSVYKTHHSSPFTAEVKKAWRHTFSP